jgi:hypothetical protein
MKSLTFTTFDTWLEMYGKASAENNPQASAELFARNAEYYETPFDEHMVRRDAIYKYWEMGAKFFKDKESSYEILFLKDNLGIARWQSKFTYIRSGKRFALDCLFLVEFDRHDKCSAFREWWHLHEVNAN